MAPQSWLIFFNVLYLIGGFIVVIGGVGIWYFGGKVDEAKDQKITELVAGKDSLLEESKKLKFQNSLMLHAIENTGHAKFNRDENGELTGVVIEMTGAAKGESSASGVVTTVVDFNE
jgi:hypothetical protein